MTSAVPPTDDPPSEDALLGGRVRLMQPRHGFRAAIDAVLLAAACPAQPGQMALELGCGTGAVSLCLLARVPDLTVLAVDRDLAMCGLAAANARRNGRSATLQVIAADIAQPVWQAGCFDHVLANPPFHDPARGRSSPRAERARAKSGTPVARAERDDAPPAAALADWLSVAASALTHGGWLTVIFRADRLDDLLRAMPATLGSPVLVPLWPRREQPARRLIFACRKGGRAPLVLHPGLVLHDDAGYTAAADAVLRDGAAIDAFGRGALTGATAGREPMMAPSAEGEARCG